MKALKLKEFLESPPFTLYTYGAEGIIWGLFVKIENILSPEGDCLGYKYRNLMMIQCENGLDRLEKIGDSIENGTSYSLDKKDYEDLEIDLKNSMHKYFMIFEKEDLNYLKSFFN